MGNVLEKTKQEQVIALGRLGWSLRRIEEATGVRRETAGGYLRSAGIALRTPGGWGHGGPSKPATLVTTGSDGSKPAIEVITGSRGPKPVNGSKPAIEVITGFSAAKAPPEAAGRGSAGPILDADEEEEVLAEVTEDELTDESDDFDEAA